LREKKSAKIRVGEAISITRVPYLRLFIFATLRLCEKKNSAEASSRCKELLRGEMEAESTIYK